MDPSALRDGLTALLGAGTGVLSALFGVGGAVASTPGIRALGASASVAVGTTLPSIIPGAATGTLRFHRAGLIDTRAVAATAPAGIVAAIGGALLSKVVPGEGHLLMLATAALLGFSAIRIASTRPGPTEPPAESPAVAGPDDITDPPITETDADMAPAVGTTTSTVSDRDHALHDRRALTRFTIVGAGAGLLSGLLGIGGGIVMVPGFTQFGRMRVKEAVATSLVCVGLFAIPGTITHAFIGDIDWRFGLWLAAGIVPGARLGSALTLRISDQSLRPIVAIFLGATAVVYATSETLALLH